MLIRYTRWTIARARFRWQMWRAERAAWYQGTDLTPVTAPTPPVTDWREWSDQNTGKQERCSCGARRCHNKARGVYCPPQRLSLWTTTLGAGTGRHEPMAAFRGIVEATWSPLAPHVRAFLAPSVHRPIINGVRRLA